jgi:hypothetical protein
MVKRTVLYVGFIYLMTLLAAQTIGAMSKGRVAYKSVGRDEEEVAEVVSR